MKKPIGIFDSGVGGLTVFKEIRKHYPYEDIVYFGDTARVPYGPKSPQTIIHYSLQNARFLLSQNVKMIVVACNTASAFALSYLQRILDIPVIGVIEPGAKEAVMQSINKQIGVIGTYGTINSNAYPKAINELLPEAKVFSKACPLFVPIVEEGMESHKISHELAEEYLENLINAGIDTLVLGCTHYPILKNTLREVTDHKINLIDSAEVIAKSLYDILPDREAAEKGKDKFFVSDNEDNFRRIAERITNSRISFLQKVELGESWLLLKNTGESDG